MNENAYRGQDDLSRRIFDRWPHVDDDMLFALWHQHSPAFVRLDEPWKESLKKIRLPFLSWLEYRGIDLETPTLIEPVALAASRGPRVKLESVDFRKSGTSAAATVAISLSGKLVEATSSRELVGQNILWLPAEAAMSAIKSLIPAVDFEVDAAFPIASRESNHEDIAVVIARDPEGVLRNRFVGACEIRSSEAEAGAKAALASINRHAEIAARLLQVD